MNYLEIMKKLCEENKGYIILMRSGVFYTAIGKNAIKLSELFGLKLLCISKELCKCSVPANAIEKYIVKFQKSNYSYRIFDYKKEGFENTGEKYRLISKIEGKLNEGTNSINREGISTTTDTTIWLAIATTTTQAIRTTTSLSVASSNIIQIIYFKEYIQRYIRY